MIIHDFETIIRRKIYLRFVVSIIFLLLSCLYLVILYHEGLFSMAGFLYAYKIDSTLESLDAFAMKDYLRNSSVVTLEVPAYKLSGTVYEYTVDDITVDDIFAGFYVEVYIDGKYLLCFLNPKEYEQFLNTKGSKYTFTGSLVPIDALAYKAMIDELAKKSYSVAEAEGYLYPYSIDNSQIPIWMIYRILSYLIMASLFAAFLTFLLKGLSVYLDISRYRGLKGLPEYKRFEDILRHIAQQFRVILPDHIFHTNPWTIVYLATNWLIVETWWNVKVYLADDLLLAHRHEEAHHVVKKPGEWSSAILVSTGNAIRIPGKGIQLNALLKGLLSAYPWIQIGYTEEIENAWFDDIKKLTDAAKRKKEKIGFIDFGASL